MPCCVKSNTFNAAERNHAPTEGEGLAVVWAADTFRHCLHGHHFTVISDHKALDWLNNPRFTHVMLHAVKYIPREDPMYGSYGHMQTLCWHLGKR